MLMYKTSQYWDSYFVQTHHGNQNFFNISIHFFRIIMEYEKNTQRNHTKAATFITIQLCVIV